VMKTEADSNDITEYAPDYKPTTGMFDFSYDAFYSMVIYNVYSDVIAMPVLATIGSGVRIFLFSLTCIVVLKHWHYHASM